MDVSCLIWSKIRMIRIILSTFAYVVVIPLIVNFYSTRSAGKKFTIDAAYLKKMTIAFFTALILVTIIDNI